MKKIFTSLLLLIFLTTVKAQYVEIESYIVRQKIKELAPDCWDGNKLDTTCSQLSSITSISLNDEAFGPDAEEIEEYFEDGYYYPPFEINLNGLQFLKSLKSLQLEISYLLLYNDASELPGSLESVSARLGDPTYYGEGEGNISLTLSSNVKYAYLSGGYRMYENSVGCTLSENLEELTMVGAFVNINNRILPNKIRKIVDESSALTSWYTLPNSLEELEIAYREMDAWSEVLSLPTFPSSLKKLSLIGFRFFDDNEEDFTPYDYSSVVLTEGLTDFIINGLQIKEPFVYPQSLRSLRITNSEFSSNIGILPENLHSLDISDCEQGDAILEDVVLPNSIKNYTIHNSGLTQQPAIPAQVEALNLSNNAIYILRDLPNTLKFIDISSNQFDVLENLPTQLESLNVSNNRNLKCLPTLPNSLKTINVTNTSITCIPNETNTIKATTALPVCPAPCEEIPDFLMGIVFLDLNKNGILDPTDRRIQGAFIHAGEKILTTNSTGEYRLYANPDAETKISVTYKHPHLDKILPAERTHTNSGNSTSVDTLNFAVQLRDVKDVEVLISPFIARNGFTPTANVTVTNRGTLPVNNFNLSLDAPAHWTFVSASPIAQSTSDSILWNNISLAVNTSRTFDVQLTIPATDTIRTPFALKAKIHQVADDETPQNNTYTYTSVIRGSFDPNDKLVYPETLTPGYVEGTELIYTVRFQNTGNDTAFTVVVKDTIQANLEPLSFRFISGTHPLVWSLNEQGVITFTFANILLPDSNVNEPASNGQVTFAIQPKAGLGSGVAVENKAAIYFDFNAPIITNTAVARVDVVTAVYERNTINMSVHPNPAKDIAHVRWTGNGRTNISVSDISGKVVYQSVETDNFLQLPVQNLSKGMYLIHIQNEQGMGVSKVIIQ